jgi:hypothetical protein
MPGPHARLIALYMLRCGLTVRDVAELLGAHPRAVVALISR